MDVVGSFLLAICGLPEYIKSLREGCNLSWSFLWLWCIGEVLLVFYAIKIEEYWLLLNYGSNSIITGHMLVMKWRRNEES